MIKKHWDKVVDWWWKHWIVVDLVYTAIFGLFLLLSSFDKLGV